jgi:hypothetical protein
MASVVMSSAVFDRGITHALLSRRFGFHARLPLGLLVVVVCVLVLAVYAPTRSVKWFEPWLSLNVGEAAFSANSQYATKLA